jgi:hypothetical protein
LRAQLDHIEQLGAAGKAAEAGSLLQKVDAHYGGLAVPRSTQLAEQLGCGDCYGGKPRFNGLCRFLTISCRGGVRPLEACSCLFGGTRGRLKWHKLCILQYGEAPDAGKRQAIS